MSEWNGIYFISTYVVAFTKTLCFCMNDTYLLGICNIQDEIYLHLITELSLKDFSSLIRIFYSFIYYTNNTLQKMFLFSNQ